MPDKRTTGERDDTYRRLGKFLDMMPGGFPETESGVEFKILRRMFAVPEAELFMNMTVTPEPASAIAERAGMDEGSVEAMLDSMSRQGSCMRIRTGDTTLYGALSFVIGLYEYHLEAIDHELAEMMQEYIPYLGKQWTAQKTQQVRIVPVDTDLETSQAIAPYDRVRELARKQDRIAVAECICRKKQHLLGHECAHSHETCIRFGVLADYFVENGAGKRISMDECLRIIDRAEEDCLVLMTTNCEEIVNVCSCCSCCCAVLKSLKALPDPAKYTVSSFQAWIDPEMCKHCNTCLKRCQMDAVVKGDEFNSIDHLRCIGCGLCAAKCPAGAITLEVRPDVVTPPLNVAERNARILEERGLG